jgi:hypothetical protein
MGAHGAGIAEVVFVCAEAEDLHLYRGLLDRR